TTVKLLWPMIVLTSVKVGYCRAFYKKKTHELARGSFFTYLHNFRRPLFSGLDVWNGRGAEMFGS
ncbi:hypothetical protein, partial [Schlesneria sp.]|uniref:hypothetical protein n=1 Tax=Schlesneria sp. TaxID=2762018 RepID=UPI002F192391